MTSQQSNKIVQIIEEVTGLFAGGGIEQTSMRGIAKKVGVAPSVLYHYFENKDDLLARVYEHNNRVLGIKRAELSEHDNVKSAFEELVNFQFDEAKRVVAVLKYYFAYREDFAREFGTLPPKAALHVEEIVQMGIDEGVYAKDSMKYVKVVAHAINGYLLEYYPYIPSKEEREEVVRDIVDFCDKSMRA